jgi:transposase
VPRLYPAPLCLWKSFRTIAKTIPGSSENSSPSRRNPCSRSARNPVRLHPGTLFAFTQESCSPCPGIPNQAYDNIGGEGLRHVGCWAHARRKFVDAVKVNAKDAAAINMVTRMDALFLIDREAREKNMTAGERLALRREHAIAWLNEIHEECLRLRSSVLPKSAVGQAVTYTLNQWQKLRRIFELGEVELSNNLAENSMRPVALGRKNWLHVGSAQAGPKVAAILSVVESCRRLGVPVKDYLLAVLPGMASKTLPEAAALSPARWAASR